MQRAPSNPAEHGSEPEQSGEGHRPIRRVHPADAEDLRAALEDVAAGRMVELSEAELAEWEATGELPASVQSRFAALPCGESRS